MSPPSFFEESFPHTFLHLKRFASTFALSKGERSKKQSLRYNHRRSKVSLKSNMWTPIRRKTAIHLSRSAWSSAKQ